MTEVFIVFILAMMLIPLVGFMYRYYRYSPWRATWQGVTLMSQKFAMVILIIYFLFVHFAADLVSERVVLAIILVLLLALFWSTFLGLLHVQRHERPVSKRQGTGYVEPEDIEKTRPRRNLPTGKK